MTWSGVLSSPLFAGLVLVLLGAIVSATASAFRATHPRLAAWLSALAAALPADVTRMNPGPAPKVATPAINTKPLPAWLDGSEAIGSALAVPADEVATAKTPIATPPGESSR